MKIFYNSAEALTPRQIDLISEAIGKSALGKKVDKKTSVQLRILTEIILIDYMQRFGENTPCTVTMYGSLSKLYLSVDISGEEFYPLNKHADIYEDDYVRMLMENVTITSSYQYSADGVNQVRLQIPKKKPSGVITSSVAIAAAVLFWLVLSFFPDNVGATIANDILSPVGNAYLSLVSMGGIMMIFLSLVSAVSGMSSIGKLKSTGGIVIRHIMSKNLIFACVFALLTPFIFKTVSGGAASGASAGKQFLDTILGIVPENIIDPFREQNALQVSFLALILGTFLLINKKYANTVIGFFNELNRVILSVVGFICKLMPFYIFISFSGLLLSNHLNDLKKCAMIPLAVVLFAFIMVLTTKIISKFKYNIPLLANFKNSANIALTGFFTSSSMACFDANRKLCLNAYGVDEENLRFSMIFQHILYKVDVLACFLCFVHGLSSVFGVKYSLPGCIVMTVSVVLLSMAVPPVPGSPLAILPPFLVSLTLPNEAVALFTAICVFINMILTGAKVFCVSDELVAMDREIKKKI